MLSPGENIPHGEQSFFFSFPFFSLTQNVSLCQSTRARMFLKYVRSPETCVSSVCYVLGISSGFDAIRFCSDCSYTKASAELEKWTRVNVYNVLMTMPPQKTHLYSTGLCGIPVSLPSRFLALSTFSPCEKCVISLLFILRTEFLKYSVFHTTSYLELFTIAKTRNLPTF